MVSVHKRYLEGGVNGERSGGDDAILPKEVVGDCHTSTREDCIRTQKLQGIYLESKEIEGEDRKQMVIN